MNTKLKIITGSLLLCSVFVPIAPNFITNKSNLSNNVQNKLASKSYDNSVINKVIVKNLTSASDDEFYSKLVWSSLLSFLTLFINADDPKNVDIEKEVSAALTNSGSGTGKTTIAANSPIALLLEGLLCPGILLRSGIYKSSGTVQLTFSGKAFTLPELDFSVIGKQKFNLFKPQAMGKVKLPTSAGEPNRFFIDNKDGDGEDQLSTIANPAKASPAVQNIKPISSILAAQKNPRDPNANNKNIRTFLDLSSVLSTNIKSLMFTTSAKSLASLSFQLPRLFTYATGQKANWQKSNDQLSNAGSLFLKNEFGINDLVLTIRFIGATDENSMQQGYMFLGAKSKIANNLAETPVIDNLVNQVEIAKEKMTNPDTFAFNKIPDLVGGVGVTFNIINWFRKMSAQDIKDPNNSFNTMFNSITGATSEPLSTGSSSWGLAAFHIENAYSATYYSDALNPESGTSPSINPFSYFGGLLNALHADPSFIYKDSSIFNHQDITSKSFLPILMGNLFKMSVNHKSLSISGNDDIQPYVNDLKNKYDNLLDNSKNETDFWNNLKQTSLAYNKLHDEELKFTQLIADEANSENLPSKVSTEINRNAKAMASSVASIPGAIVNDDSVQYCTNAFSFMSSTIGFQQTYSQFKIGYTKNDIKAGLSTGAIVGIVIGSIAGAALIGTGLFFLGKNQGWWKGRSYAQARSAKQLDIKKTKHDKSSPSTRDLS